MPPVDLEDAEWRQVLAILAQAPWNVANPLIMKIGQQLQAAQPKPDGEDKPVVRQ
jgi:hypothetical protein